MPGYANARTTFSQTTFPFFHDFFEILMEMVHLAVLTLSYANRLQTRALSNLGGSECGG